MQKHLQNLFALLAMMVIPCVSQGQAFNYTCNFDNDSDTIGWVLLNGSQTNKWVIDTATHNSGTKSLYISRDDGISNTYNARSVSIVYAYQDFALQAGYYSISYDWKCYGESDYDYIRVFLAPDIAPLTAGQTPTGGTYTLGWSSAALPSGFISLTDSTTKLNLQSSWQSIHTNIIVPSSDNYHLVFAWANDDMSGAQPPAAIDNIQIQFIGCPPVENLSVTNIRQTSAIVTWTDTFNSSYWIVEYGASGFTVGTGTSIVVYGTTTTLTGLAPDSSYDVYVTPDCLIGDAVTEHISFRTIGCPPVENLSVSNITQTSADITWTDTLNTTSWTVEYGVSGFSVGTGTSVVVNDTSTTLTGLTPYTLYDVYVTPNCIIGNSVMAHVDFRTQCSLIDNLPWCDDFESYSMGSSYDFVPCYHRLSDGTNVFYPFFSANYANNHTPNGGCYLSWSINFRSIVEYGRYQCAVLPGFDTSIDASALQLNFWAKANSTHGTPSFKVGVMTDPDDISTFVTVNTVVLTGSDWQEVTVPLSAYTGNGHYVAIKADIVHSSDSWTAAIDDITLDYITTCHIPEVVYSTGAISTSITLNWVDIDPAIAWRVEYGPHGYTSESSLITTAHPVTINGLRPLTEYDFYVLPICAEGDTARCSCLRYPTTLSTTMCENNLIAATGSDTSTGTTYYYPVNNLYGYTLTETIIDSAELGGAMNIEYISYYYDYATAMTRKDNCTIYIQPTSLSTFNSTADAVGLDTNTAVMVYTGPLNCSQGWNYFLLDNAYYYDGTGNLLVIVDDNSKRWNDNRYVFKTQPCTGNKTFYCYSDTYNPDMLKPWAFPHSKGIDSSRVVMQLISCSPPVCDVPTDIYTIVDSNAVTINWTAGDGNISFELEYGPHGFNHGTGTIVTATSSPITLSNLDYATDYDIYVRTLCDHDIYSDWSDLVSFTTGSVGIDDVTEPTCTIYPNPSWRKHPYGSSHPTATITVAGISGKVRISVLDMTGRKVMSELIECYTNCEKHLNIEGLTDGAYIVHVTSESHAPIVKKLIIK